jgi:DNA-binding protein HU-beta
MNNSNLVDLTGQLLDCSKAKAAQAVDAVLASIVTLAEHGPLAIRSFGRFEMRTRSARTVLSGVAAGKTFEVPERTNLTFKASKSLRRG